MAITPPIRNTFLSPHRSPTPTSWEETDTLVGTIEEKVDMTFDEKKWTPSALKTWDHFFTQMPSDNDPTKWDQFFYHQNVSEKICALHQKINQNQQRFAIMLTRHDVSNRRYQCPVAGCGVFHWGKPIMREHIQTSHPNLNHEELFKKAKVEKSEKPYKCKVVKCTSAFSKKRYLVDHLRRDHPNLRAKKL